MQITVLQTLFITITTIMVIELVAPVINKSRHAPDPLLTRYVVPLDKSTTASEHLAYNHVRHLIDESGIKPENISLVVFDKGIYLLQANQVASDRMQALLNCGVQFYACEQSLARVKQKWDSNFMLLDGVQLVPDGKHQIDSLMDEGYVNLFA